MLIIERKCKKDLAWMNRIHRIKREANIKAAYPVDPVYRCKLKKMQKRFSMDEQDTQDETRL
jgi:hypothetical protein